MPFLSFLEGIFKAGAIMDCVQPDAVVEKVALIITVHIQHDPPYSIDEPSKLKGCEVFKS